MARVARELVRQKGRPLTLDLHALHDAGRLSDTEFHHYREVGTQLDPLAAWPSPYTPTLETPRWPMTPLRFNKRHGVTPRCRRCSGDRESCGLAPGAVGHSHSLVDLQLGARRRRLPDGDPLFRLDACPRIAGSARS